MFHVMKRASKSTPRWRITRIVGRRAEQLSELEAKSADDAIKRYIRQSGVTDPMKQKRIVPDAICVYTREPWCEYHATRGPKPSAASRVARRLRARNMRVLTVLLGMPTITATSRTDLPR